MAQFFQRPAIAIGFFIFAMALIPLNDSFIKLMSSHLSIFQILAMRAIVCLTILALIPGVFRSLRGLSASTFFKLTARGFFLVGAMLFFFLPLATLSLAETTAIFFTAPLIISLLSIPVLGEKLGIYRILAVIVGMIGVLVIVRPGGSGFTPAYLMPMLAALSYASYQIVTRYIRNEASLLAMVTIQNLVYFLTGVFGVLAIIAFVSVEPEGEIWGFLLRGLDAPETHEYIFLLVGGFIVLNLSFASANVYSNVEATLIAPFEYVALPTAVFWGIVIWGDWPDLNAWIGIILIIGAGVFMVYRENLNAQSVASAVPMRSASTNTINVEDEDLISGRKYLPLPLCF